LNKAGELLSKEKRVNKIFDQIVGIPDPKTRIAIPGTGIAEAGDLLFFITHGSDKQSFYNSRPKTLKTRLITNPLQPFFRRCSGYSKNDFDEWHVSIYFMGRKRKRHKRVNVWMLNSQPSIQKKREGVDIRLLSPNFFLSGPTKSRRRMEILKFKGINKEQRKQIKDFSFSKTGSKFDYFIRRKALLTTIFGLPNFLHDQRMYACQSLIISAYHAAGICFSHPYHSFPLCNIGRYLGRPLGHSKEKVNPNYPYLMDHHIYRDPRFEVKAAVFFDQKTNDFKLEKGDIGKYSWNKKLRDIYLAENRC